MRIFRLTIIVLLLSVSGLRAEVKIIFKDGASDLQQRVRNYAKKQKAANLTDSLTIYLLNQGFLDNYMNLREKDSIISLSIKFGDRYTVGKIILESDRYDTVEINRPLEEKNINGVLDSIITDFQSRGFYYASAVPVSWEKRGSTVDYYLKFQKGQPVTISSVDLEGLNKTRPSFLQRYLSIGAGDTLEPQKIENSALDFERLDFVRLESPPVIIPEVGLEKADISYHFSELQQYYFEGAGGYIPDDNGYFIWMLNLSGRNIFGAGQRAGLFVDRRERLKSIFRVFYGQPVFLLGPDYAELKIQTRDYREEFYEFGLGLSYDLFVRRELSLNSSLNWKNVEPADTLSRAFEVYEAGFAIKIGNIYAHRAAPTDFAMDWRLNYSGRHYKPLSGDTALSRSVYNDARSDLTGEISLPVLSFVSDYHLLNIKTIESTEKPLPLSELFLFGGARTLRGYRNDQFAARKLLLFKSELRFFVSESDYLYPFYDIAGFEWYRGDTENETVKRDDYKYGYGLGIRLASASRQLNIELSWGESTIFNEPRLNIILSNQF